MKFFHVYNEQYFDGLVKNGLLNKDTGFKIQHAFSMDESIKFNRIAQKDGKLHALLKENRYPFYADRLAGGITYHEYRFDPHLIDTYREMLGEWFLGFQLHESASNRRQDWKEIIRAMDGDKGPYDPDLLRERMKSAYARMPDGTLLLSLSQGRAEEYAARRYAEQPHEVDAEIEEMFRLRMQETQGNILPCDSFFLYTNLQDKLGMKSFMPEVGAQIPLMRIEVALARGIAKQSGKLWGVYYETWIGNLEEGYSMPCYNNEPGNEWYLTQETHHDDFTTKGANGGSSRLLQRRIYYYALMSGADYFSEEWGLNCSYSDMKIFSLSPYGEAKKEFIDSTQLLPKMKAYTPFALVLPKDYQAIELPDIYDPWTIGNHRDTYLHCALNAEQQAYYGHIEDVLKLIWTRNGKIYGNESHVLTNSRFGDLFDIIYEDASEETLEKYEYLIDASPNGSFAQKKGKEFRVLSSADLGSLEHKLHEVERELLPCTVDSLHWMISCDNCGGRYLSIFNNEGNERSVRCGDAIDHEADAAVTVRFKENAIPEIIKATDGVRICANSDREYRVDVLATGFVILKF